MMPFTPLLRCLAALLLALLAACAQTPPPAADTPLEQAAAALAQSLLQQLERAPPEARRGIVVDPLIEAGTGQQTAATRALAAALVQRLQHADGARLAPLPFEAAALQQARYLLTGTFTRLAAERTRPAFRVDVALTQLPGGTIAAQAHAALAEDGLDTRVPAWYRDSPVLLKDAVLDGYVRTSAGTPGAPADPAYFTRLVAAPSIEHAQALYGENRYDDALLQYETALATPAGEQLRVLNGVYLANWRLGRRAEAERAFGRVVAMGIAYQQLGVKFLFRPGSTEFWPDPEVNAAYPMWLRQIAAETRQAAVCMDVVGHTSRTGSAQVNDVLSLQRAARMQQLLAERAGELGPRLKPGGMGFRENIVGSGTDDVLDALDRRVEFKIVPCS